MARESGIRPLWVLLPLGLGTFAVMAGFLFTHPEPADAGRQGSLNPAVSSAGRPTSAGTSTATAWDLAGAEPAVAGFLAAWSTVDPAARRSTLERTATRTLAAQLALTDPAKVPRACMPTGVVAVVDRTDDAVLVTVPTSCEGTLWLGLVADDSAAYRWRVSAIGKERSWIQ